MDFHPCRNKTAARKEQGTHFFPLTQSARNSLQFRCGDSNQQNVVALEFDRHVFGAGDLLAGPQIFAGLETLEAWLGETQVSAFGDRIQEREAIAIKTVCLRLPRNPMQNKLNR